MCRHWLELTITSASGKGIKRAKEGHTLGRITLSLFYATDFADRLENEIVPALRAGFVVLTDRYIVSRWHPSDTTRWFIDAVLALGLITYGWWRMGRSKS